MIHDLLVLDNGKYSIKMEEDSEKKAGAAALDEEDPIWRLIRHWHFAEAIEYISDTFKKFLGSNKAAEAALGSTDGPSGIEALNQMKDTLSALPEFQEMKSKFSLHINICQECQSVFEKRSIGPIAGIEQDLATGETSDGRVAKGIMQGLVPILFDDKIPYVKPCIIPPLEISTNFALSCYISFAKRGSLTKIERNFCSIQS
jgi:syntaxin-binding protein 1